MTLEDQLEAALRLAIKTHEALNGPSHPGSAVLLQSLADVLKTQGRIEESDLLMGSAKRIKLLTLAPLQPDIAIRFAKLAQLLRTTGRLSEAEPLLRTAVTILLRHTAECGRTHTELLAMMSTYAELCNELGFPPEDFATRMAGMRSEAGLAEKAPALQQRMRGTTP